MYSSKRLMSTKHLHDSTHNTRIERLWVEVGCHFCREWRAFFTRLERRHLLDRENKQHLWLIHKLFLEDINMDCHSFQAEWNAHPISGPDTNDRSPNDLRLLVAATQHSNIRHAAIPVPSNSNPFESEDSEALYFDALDLIRLEGTIPAGFGALPIEHAYEAEEVIRLGRRGRKELAVGLPEHIWRPQIELWAQAVHLLNEFMYGDGV
ncbi:hypothetical protein WOLCODRAFT_146872 [Wolfiporia cocos MD-104 SS10]|uniref:Integrase core domain-containing protein n=1 Tax=Wolfiporia cocos (strain MD-104) TaxID=742152 RepID=A0A2H3JC56_WOLCO|nr:hypothetical protein WOLCODRAFT_146872 [Wolfiporia cocos MD-104 SS10]